MERTRGFISVGELRGMCETGLRIEYLEDVSGAIFRGTRTDDSFVKLQDSDAGYLLGPVCAFDLVEAFESGIVASQDVDDKGGVLNHDPRR